MASAISRLALPPIHSGYASINFAHSLRSSSMPAEYMALANSIPFSVTVASGVPTCVNRRAIIALSIIGVPYHRSLKNILKVAAVAAVFAIVAFAVEKFFPAYAANAL